VCLRQLLAALYLPDFGTLRVLLLSDRVAQAWGIPACIGKQQACAEPFLQAVKGRSLGIIDVDPGVPPRQLTNVAHDQAQPESSSAPITAVNGCHLLGEEPCRKLYGPPQSPWWPQTGGYPLRKAEFLLRRKATLEFVQNYFGRFFHEGVSAQTLKRQTVFSRLLRGKVLGLPNWGYVFES